MFKWISFILLVFMVGMLSAATLTVNLDGTTQYTSIQSAIDASVNGDIIQVYPGVYSEALETNGKSITLQSLFPTTLSQETIDNTVIHPTTVSSCIEIDNGETVTINGFTFTNNDPVNLIPDYYDADNDGVWGGGIEITNHSSVSILNCIVQNCIAPGGGVYFHGTGFNMSNTSIRNCIGTNLAGGLTIEANSNSIIQFDSAHPNSIYNNKNRDVFMRDVPDTLHVDFDIFSIELTEPDSYFFSSSSNVHITVQHPYYSLINHDLYVSPGGDDTNSGLSSNNPFKTIYHAIQVIQPDSLNPKTIHLSPGIYSITGNEQFFPLRLKSHMKLIGDSSETTILDENNALRYYIGVANKNDIEVRNLKFVGYPESGAPVGFSNTYSAIFRDLEFDGNAGYTDGIDGSDSRDIVLENILVHNSTVNDDGNTAFRMLYVDNLIMNNCIADNMQINGYNGNNVGFEIWESDVTIRNSIISNCTTDNTYVFFYQNVNEEESAYSLDMSNMLIVNNYSEINDPWASSLVSLHNNFQRMQISNCTIANNRGSDTCPVQINGEADIRNSIFYNPDMYWDVSFMTFDEVQYHPTISNTLLHRTVAADHLEYVQQNNLLLNSNPLFAGMLNNSLPISDPAYYQLSSSSPCINAGLQDTTGLNISVMDLAGNHRVWDGRIDMGCYEFGSVPVGNHDDVQGIYDPEVSFTTYPNPVYLNGTRSHAVFLEFSLPEKSTKSPMIEIFNIRGQLVKSIEVSSSMNDMRSLTKDKTGFSQTEVPYSTAWNLKNDQNREISSGVYIVKLNAGKYQAVHKMMVVK